MVAHELASAFLNSETSVVAEYISIPTCPVKLVFNWAHIGEFASVSSSKLLVPRKRTTLSNVKGAWLGARSHTVVTCEATVIYCNVGVSSVAFDLILLFVATPVVCFVRGLGKVGLSEHFI